jgi:hypothetical protein
MQNLKEKQQGIYNFLDIKSSLKAIIIIKKLVSFNWFSVMVLKICVINKYNEMDVSKIKKNS